MPELKTASSDLSWRSNVAALAGIVLLGGLLYSQTLQVPWYLDDIRAIVENPSIRQLQNALDNLFVSSRGFVDFTFALNYHFGQTELPGYHLVNIAIHLLTSCLVFLLLRRVFRHRPSLALCGALVFVAHPLQTQAVTYIVQRTTSLAALFFFLALYLYVLSREAPNHRWARHWALYLAALLSGALAVLAKENTAVLPMAIILFDRYFLAKEDRLAWRRQWLIVAPFALAPAVLAIKSLMLPILTEGGLTHIGGTPDLVHLRHLSPLNYLVTEFSVIWIYLRLLFFPHGQALDYDVPIVATLWSLKNVIALVGVMALLATAVYLRRKLPLVSAGILWFFLSLSVESTIIPLDPVFEHRLYIPMFGFILVVMAGFARLPGKTAWAGGVLLVGILAILTWQRNQLWNDPIAFYQDNLEQAPRSERVHVELANAYRKQGFLDQAETLYHQALAINPDYAPTYVNLSVVYVTKKRFFEAEAILLKGLRSKPREYRLYNNLGVLYNRLGQFDQAAAYLKNGLQVNPDNASLHFNLALALARLGQRDEAIQHYQRSIALDKTKPDTYFNLGMALYRQGHRQEARLAFEEAARLDPEDIGALYNLALVSLEIGDVKAAQESLARLRSLDPKRASTLQQRIQKQLPRTR